MDLLGGGLFDLAERKLAWLDRRQQVLAQNVANADTPGFRPRDLPVFDARPNFDARLAAAGQPARTQPGHLPGSVTGGASDGLAAAAGARPKSRQPDGNAVALDEELTKVADVQASQALVGNLYAKYLGFYRLALGRGA